MSALEKIDRIQFNKDITISLLDLYEYKGKIFYYENLFQRDEKAFIKNSIEKDIFSLARFINIDITDARLKLLARNNLVAKNKDEQLIINLKKAFTLLKNNVNNFEMHTNELYSLMKLISKDTYQFDLKGTFNQDEGIEKKSPKRKSEEIIENLFKLYNKLVRSKKHEHLHLMINFFVDLIEYDIINDDKLIISHMMLYSILIQTFPIFKYVSFFEYLEKEKKMWESSITQARYYWSTGFAQTEMLVIVFVDILMKAFKEIDQEAYIYEFQKTLNKSDSIENTIYKIDEVFSKNDIRTIHPNISEATIDRTLKRLRDENIIRPIGVGRGAKWQRLVKSMKKDHHIEVKTLFDLWKRVAI